MGKSDFANGCHKAQRLASKLEHKNVVRSTPKIGTIYNCYFRASIFFQ